MINALTQSLTVPDYRQLELTTIFQTSFDNGSATGSFTTFDPPQFTKALNSDKAFFADGSATAYQGLGSNLNVRGWVHNRGKTGSSNTGPDGDHGGGFNQLGAINAFSEDAADCFMFFESSVASGASNAYRASHGQGGDGAIRAVRTGALDFSGFSTVELTMFAHLKGGSIGLGNTGIGLAVTTEITSSAADVEAGTALGFTSRIAGGARFKVMEDNSLTSEDSTHTNQLRLGAQGQIQTGTSDRWRYVTADLSAAAGQSEVYVWLAYFTGINCGANNSSTSLFLQDVAVDDIQIRGLK
jgi:hypothetical protein